MKVRELIEALSACDPDARVVLNEPPIIEGDHNIMEGAMQEVVGLEVGWASADISSDLTFCLKEIRSYTTPAVRLVGPNDEPTNPDMKLTINGRGPVGSPEENAEFEDTIVFTCGASNAS